MIRLGIALSLAAGMLVFGCATAVDQSLYRRVGHSSGGKFYPDPSFKPPDASFLSAQQIFSEFDKLCYGGGTVYHCTYFANDDAYYLLPNYRVVPTFSISSHARVVVDAHTGKLVKSE